MTVMYKKELRQLFGGVRGFAVIGILLLICGFYTVFQNLLSASPDFSIALTGMLPALIVALPILSAKSFATERTCGTHGLLYSLSLRPSDIVLGKYLAHLTVFSITMLVIAIYPLILSFFGMVEMGKIYFAWFGMWLLGAALLSICLFFSLFFKNAWANWGLGAAILLFLYLIQLFLTALPSAAWFSLLIIELALIGVCVWLLLVIGSKLAVGCFAILPIGTAILFAINPSLFTSLLSRILSQSNPFARFAGFIYGRFDLQGILFFISVAVLFVYATVKITDCRRDKEN